METMTKDQMVQFLRGMNAKRQFLSDEKKRLKGSIESLEEAISRNSFARSDDNLGTSSGCVNTDKVLHVLLNSRRDIEEETRNCVLRMRDIYAAEDQIDYVCRCLYRLDGQDQYLINEVYVKDVIMDQLTAVLSLDIAYGLYPELMTEACRNYLQEAMDENEWIDVSNAVRYCENFQKRYDVEIEGLKKAKEMEKRLDYENKPDIPKVGMTLSQAYDTKLGVPTRSDRKKSTYAGADHYWGHLYWDQGGRQIFSAYCGDNVIKDVWDTRTCQGKPRRKYSGSSGKSSSSSLEPDDHDIEAYYDDNRDEYDSYEDAYEGFLDYESSWDDY